jgi:Na+/H+ antiporter NhaD/arsenite permease-like protein
MMSRQVAQGALFYGGVWGAAFGNGIIATLLSSAMNNMPTVLAPPLPAAFPKTVPRTFSLNGAISTELWE